MSFDYDILIVGGSLVGASLACALQNSGLRVAVVEGRPINSAPAPLAQDERAIALALGSKRIFDGLGMWQPLAKQSQPIKHIHISDRGHFGSVRLSAEEEKVEALGFVVPANDLIDELRQFVIKADDFDLMCPATLQSINDSGDGVTVEIDCDGDRKTVRTRLLVGADGENSFVRHHLKMPVEERSYDQIALITSVSTEEPHEGQAYERFTEDGPIALLPMLTGRCAVVWTLPPERAEQMLDADDDVVLHSFQQAFGYRLGRFSGLGPRQRFPLHMSRVHSPVCGRAVLIGSAANTLHPVAAQGFNLGLRDIAALAELVLDAHAAGRDVGGVAVLNEYLQWRGRDHKAMGLFTDGLAHLFSNSMRPVALARNIGLVGFSMFAPLRHLMCKHTLGLSGRVSRLARNRGA